MIQAKFVAFWLVIQRVLLMICHRPLVLEFGKNSYNRIDKKITLKNIFKIVGLTLYFVL